MTSSPQDNPAPEAQGPRLGVELRHTSDISVSHVVCPHCETANRIGRQTCVQCERDIAMLSVIANKAKHHFNVALEHAERRRWDDAITELRNCLDLDSNHVNAWNVLGTCLAKIDRFDEAREAWEAAIQTDARFAKAHDYLERVEHVGEARRYYRRLRNVTGLFIVVLGVVIWQVWSQVRPAPALEPLSNAHAAFQEGRHGDALGYLDRVILMEPSREILLSARALSDAINAEFDEARTHIENALARRDWHAGLLATTRLRSLQPPDTLERLAIRYEMEFATRLAEEARAKIEAMTRNEVTPEDALEAIATLPTMPTQSLRTEVENLHASAEAIVAVRRRDRFEVLLTDVLSDTASLSPAERLLTLTALWSEWNDQDALAAALETAALDTAADARVQWEGLSQTAQPSDLHAYAESLTSLMASAEQSGAWTGPIQSALAPLTIAVASAEQAIPRAEYAQARSAILGLMAEENWPAALTAVDALQASDLTAEEREWAQETRDVCLRLQFEDRLSEAESLMESERWSDALAALNALTLDHATDDECDRVAQMRETAAEGAVRDQRTEAVALLERFLDRDVAYETLSISEDEARETIDRWEAVVENVPDTLYNRSFRTRYCLFYAARAHERLGEMDEAIALLERLLEEFGETSSGPLAERHLNRLRGESGS